MAVAVVVAAPLGTGRGAAAAAPAGARPFAATTWLAGGRDRGGAWREVRARTASPRWQLAALARRDRGGADRLRASVAWQAGGDGRPGNGLPGAGLVAGALGWSSPRVVGSADPLARGSAPRPPRASTGGSRDGAAAWVGAPGRFVGAAVFRDADGVRRAAVALRVGGGGGAWWGGTGGRAAAQWESSASAPLRLALEARREAERAALLVALGDRGGPLAVGVAFVRDGGRRFAVPSAAVAAAAGPGGRVALASRWRVDPAAGTGGSGPSRLEASWSTVGSDGRRRLRLEAGRTRSDAGRARTSFGGRLDVRAARGVTAEAGAGLDGRREAEGAVRVRRRGVDLIARLRLVDGRGRRAELRASTAVPGGRASLRADLERGRRTEIALEWTRRTTGPAP